METVALISCTKSKRKFSCEAYLLYDKSIKFKKSLAYARTIASDIFILSAKHGLVSLDTVIEPYDQMLIGKSRREKDVWGQHIAEQLTEIFDIKNTMFVILAGKAYYAPLQGRLPHILLPLRGLGQGKSLTKLNALLLSTIK